MSLLALRGVHKSYGNGAAPVSALRGIDLDLPRGTMTAIVGPSGCGKSTLLHLCGGMDVPTAGTIALDGQHLHALEAEALALVRRDRVGFVFQSFNLLPTLTALENISLPLLLAGSHPDEARRRAREIGARMGLSDRLSHYPRQLSGGEMQRAAIARAVIHAPVLVIADEPTGSLDSENGARVLDLLRDLNRQLGVTVLLATHDLGLAASADIIVHLRDGRVQRVEDRASLVPGVAL